MQTLKLDLNYPSREMKSYVRDGNEIHPTPQQLTWTLINAGFQKKYEKGTSRQNLKMIGKIIEKILGDSDEVTKTEVELSDEQFNFIYETITTVEYHPAYSTVYLIFCDYLDAIKIKSEQLLASDNT